MDVMGGGSIPSVSSATQHVNILPKTQAVAGPAPAGTQYIISQVDEQGRRHQFIIQPSPDSRELSQQQLQLLLAQQPQLVQQQQVRYSSMQFTWHSGFVNRQDFLCERSTLTVHRQWFVDLPHPFRTNFVLIQQ